MLICTATLKWETKGIVPLIGNKHAPLWWENRRYIHLIYISYAMFL